MNVTMDWENEARTVLRYTFAGDWDWDDFSAVLVDHSQEFALDQLCIVIDLRQTTHIPTDAILHLLPAANRAKQIGGKIVVIATSSIAVTTFRMFVTIYRSVGRKFYLAASDEEAATYLGIG